MAVQDRLAVAALADGQAEIAVPVLVVRALALRRCPADVQPCSTSHGAAWPGRAAAHATSLDGIAGLSRRRRRRRSRGRRRCRARRIIRRRRRSRSGSRDLRDNRPRSRRARPGLRQLGAALVVCERSPGDQPPAAPAAAAPQLGRHRVIVSAERYHGKRPALGDDVSSGPRGDGAPGADPLRVTGRGRAAGWMGAQLRRLLGSIRGARLTISSMCSSMTASTS